MISSARTATQLMIIARPDQSATWRANVLLLLALAAALYHVNWKQQYRHVITVSDDSMWIAKGHYAPRQRWRFVRHNTGLTITTEQHPGDGPELCVHDRNESVTLGEFLKRDDSLKLIDLLQQEIRVRSHSIRTLREF